VTPAPPADDPLAELLHEALEYAEHTSWRCEHPPHYYLVNGPPADDCACGLIAFERRARAALEALK